MTKLKLGSIEDDKPVKLTIELPAAVHRNLVAYAEAISQRPGSARPARLHCPYGRAIHGNRSGLREGQKANC